MTVIGHERLWVTSFEGYKWCCKWCPMHWHDPLYAEEHAERHMENYWAQLCQQ